MEQQFRTHLEGHLSLIRSACVCEAVIGGEDNRCYFAVIGYGNRSEVAVKPSSAFGIIDPLKMVDLEVSAEARTMEETLGGEVPRLLVGAFNRQIDLSVIGALDASREIGAAALSAGSSDIVDRALTRLGNNEVPIEESEAMFALITPALRSYLMQTTEFANGMYVEWRDVRMGGTVRRLWHWCGINWISSLNLSGIGTTEEKCYVLHRNSLGHALDLLRLATPGAVTGGIDSKTGLGWMKAKTKQRAAVLQPSGIQRIVFDGTKYDYERKFAA